MQTCTSLAALCTEALRRDPTQPGVQFEGQQFLWGDLRRVADQLAMLIDAAGLMDTGFSNRSLIEEETVARPTVALIARNRPSTLAAFLGLVSLNCTVRMVYPFQAAPAIARNLETINPDVVIASTEDFAESVRALMRDRQMAAIGLTEMAAAAIPGFERGRARSQDDGKAEPQIILLTSGTTGLPKQFPLAYDTVARYMAGNLAMSPGGKVDDSTPILLYFPVSNISGLYATLPPLLRGTPIILHDRFNLAGWLDYIRTHRPKVSGLPPAVFKALLDGNVSADDLASLEYLGAGAAPLDINVHRAFEARYGIPILLSYGATEFAGPVCAMTPELWRRWGTSKIGSVGHPLPGMAVRIVDAERGTEVPAGEEGIVEVVSCRIGPAWIRTSDLGVIDGDGFLFLRGRADGAIIRGGFKLLPATIEAALLKHPAIEEAAVTAVRDERLGQVPGAAVVLKADAGEVTTAAIETHLREHLPATHIPTHWKFIDALPRTPSMKVDMPLLRQLFVAN